MEASERELRCTRTAHTGDGYQWRMCSGDTPPRCWPNGCLLLLVTSSNQALVSRLRWVCGVHAASLVETSRYVCGRFWSPYGLCNGREMVQARPSPAATRRRASPSGANHLHFDLSISSLRSLIVTPPLSSTMRRPSTPTLLILSGTIQLALLAYAAYVDAHPEKFGGLRYTDVDWRVVADGLAITANPLPSQVASGPLAPSFVGSPYHRATFRYTPLLVIILAPALVAPIAGRLVLVALTLALPPLLLSTGADFWKTHLLWTLNPIVLNITTRGSPEAVACLFTAGLVVALRKGGVGSAAGKASQRALDAAAALLAISASYKIYPAIYASSIWAALAQKYGWFGARVWRFGFVAAATALLLNGALYAV